MIETLKPLQFRAAYNLPIHAGVETGIFAHHEIALEIAYTRPVPCTLAKLLKKVDMISAIPAPMMSSPTSKAMTALIFLSLGLHSGLFSLVAALDCASIDSLSSSSIGVDAKTSGFVLALEAMLHARGFAGNDYQLFEVDGWESRYRALLEGKITATL